MIDDLLALADRLAKASPRRPRQADIRRSISTAYYALFHALARNGADLLVGTTKAYRSEKAWQQMYRALDHGRAKSASEASRNLGFPQDLKDCADAFVELQKARHDADYDPLHRPSRQDALQAAARARDAISKLRGAPIKHRRAFAVQLLMQKR
ncbi:MAG: hypothetical protein WBR13_14980 [Allosphingosinicella sp.]